ncbi:helix-turn-helix domain-containing protein [Luteibacter sahnii]|uniref:helix-turn-helix domain-containing protein n=1 Tax=Luteibacter sahnii TaxID=3021977 RepID=UPI002A6B2CD6|nr:helix-turn-helix transcriptional regulator [Luteibacter sp. PPL193]MDY1548540.1 helix-turn-helix transcriptional regulator [Luteibacter sp. PPL193]
MSRLPPKPPRTTAQKSHARPEYAVIGETLRAFRVEAGLTQVDLAGSLGRSQNYVSQAETGQKRLDGLQLLDWSRACGRSLREFGTLVESAIDAIDRGG